MYDRSRLRRDGFIAGWRSRATGGHIHAHIRIPKTASNEKSTQNQKNVYTYDRTSEHGELAHISRAMYVRLTYNSMERWEPSGLAEILHSIEKRQYYGYDFITIKFTGWETIILRRARMHHNHTKQKIYRAPFDVLPM